jgi:hypothetical protein
VSNHGYFGWLGVHCPQVGAAVWMMRGLVAFNAMPRREETTLFVPVDPSDGLNARAVGCAVATVYRLAGDRGVL